MLNNNAVSTGAGIVIVFTISLFISSTLISYFAINAYGYDLSGNPSFNLPEIYAPPEFSQSQDFTTNSVNESAITQLGTWDYISDLGYKLISNPLVGSLISTPLRNKGAILENYIQKDQNGIITNTYQINNSIKTEYSIILRLDRLGDSGIYPNILVIKEDGFHVPSASFYLLNPDTWGADKAFYAYPNANKIENVVITTVYNDNDYTLNLNFNGQPIVMNNLNEDNKGSGYIYEGIYGGVITRGEGFILKSFNTQNPIGNSIYKTSSIDALSASWAFISTMFKTLTWGLPEYIMPAFLQYLMIETQEFALGVGIFAMIRGS